jgi:hypothetical protein
MKHIPKVIKQPTQTATPIKSMFLSRNRLLFHHTSKRPVKQPVETVSQITRSRQMGFQNSQLMQQTELGAGPSFYQ